jgi:hypothetical protein
LRPIVEDLGMLPPTVLIISTSTFEEHILKVEKCFQRIEKAGLKINPDKSFFGKKEIE